MKKLLLLFAILLSLSSLTAQISNMPIHIGYFTPYGIQPGLKVGTSLELKKFENETNDNFQTLSISPQLGYYGYNSYANVYHTVVLDAHLDYRRYATNQQFYGLVAIGLGHQMMFQKLDVGVNLGTGETIFNNKTVHYFVPTFQLGFGKTSVKQLGYYFKGFVGERINTSIDNDLFFGAELGLSFYIRNK